MNLFDSTVSFLGRVLDLSSARHEILAGNIANADTPGYRGVDLVFEDEMREAVSSTRGTGLARTHSKHLPAMDSFNAVVGHIEATPAAIMGNDRNSVSIEHDMAKLAENSLLYETAVQALTKKFRGLMEAIREGR